MTSQPARDLRDLLAAAAARATSDAPLRVLVERRAPLTSQGERLGFLDTLLRISCLGDGRGPGVMAFDWPQAADGHSVVRLIERWRARSAASAELEVEYREGSMRCNGAEPTPSRQLKARFDADRIPDALLELLELACRVGALQPVREAVEKLPDIAAAPAPSPNGNGNGKATAAPVELPTRPPCSPEEQQRIDQIVNHAAYDSELHPNVIPNTEVVNSNGEVFRLIVRRSRGAMQRQWLRVGNAPASVGS